MISTAASSMSRSMHGPTKSTDVGRRDKTAAYVTAMAEIVRVMVMRISIAAKYINIRRGHIRFNSDISRPGITRVNITGTSK